MCGELRVNNDHHKEFAKTNSSIWFLSPVVSKGKAVNLLIIDEAAFIKDMGDHWKAIYPVLSSSSDGRCITLSTVNGVGNWFHEVWTDPDKNQFKQIVVDYREHPEYQKPEWVEEMKKNLGIPGFRQEVECEFTVPTYEEIIETVSNMTDMELAERLKVIFIQCISSNNFEAKIASEELLRRFLKHTSSKLK